LHFLRDSGQAFDQAALALHEDWGTHPSLRSRTSLDGKQIQRWAEAMGRTVTATRNAEVYAYEQGHRPAPPANAPALLVIGMDGSFAAQDKGRVQTREKQGENGSRWREDKVSAITSYPSRLRASLPGDETADHPPTPLVTTYVATPSRLRARMGKLVLERSEGTEAFGKLVHVEAERRGMRQASTVLVMGDGGNWIDPLSAREGLYDRRIVDYYHAAEHLFAAARGTLGKDTPETWALAGQLKDALWDGQLDQVIATLKTHAERLGPLQACDGPDHPRRVLTNNVDYFETHHYHMDYPTFRRKGWPIGSGVTESAVKQFNKRVKGTEQFWSVPGVETILSLRALWLSQDGRWERFLRGSGQDWNTRPA